MLRARSLLIILCCVTASRGSKLCSRLQKIPAAAHPTHLGVIMDGNARWAKEHNVPTFAGHEAGVNSLRNLVEDAASLDGVRTLTVYAFSSENWGRPRAETIALMALIESTLRTEAPALAAENINLGFIGDLNRLPSSLRALCVDLQRKRVPSQEERLHFVIALSYGGRQQIAAAARELCQRVAAGDLLADDVDEALLAATLQTDHGGPPADPDLILRTGGQQRLSNFLTFESAYAELAWTDTLWPSFDSDALADALERYAESRRTFGVRNDK